MSGAIVTLGGEYFIPDLGPPFVDIYPRNESEFQGFVDLFQDAQVNRKPVVLESRGATDLIVPKFVEVSYKDKSFVRVWYEQHLSRRYGVTQ